MTPTSGGSATGSATRAPSRRRPGISLRSNRNPSGTPIAAAASVESTEIHSVRHIAFHSSARVKKDRNASVVGPSASGPPMPKASAATTSSG